MAQPFVFSASALGAGTTASVTDQVAAVLPSVGGSVHITAQDVKLQGVSIAKQISIALDGHERDDDYITFARIEVTGLNINNTIQADSILIQVQSTFPKGRAALSFIDRRHIHPSVFDFSGSAYRGLVINGKPYTLELRKPTVVLSRAQTLQTENAGEWTAHRLGRRMQFYSTKDNGYIFPGDANFQFPLFQDVLDPHRRHVDLEKGGQLRFAVADVYRGSVGVDMLGFNLKGFLPPPAPAADFRIEAAADDGVMDLSGTVASVRTNGHVPSEGDGG